METPTKNKNDGKMKSAGVQRFYSACLMGQ